MLYIGNIYYIFATYMLYYTKTSHFLKIYESVKKRFQRGKRKFSDPGGTSQEGERKFFDFAWGGPDPVRHYVSIHPWPVHNLACTVEH